MVGNLVSQIHMGGEQSVEVNLLLGISARIESLVS